ncbi:MAG: hypothetical protein ABSF55_03665, partial [Candidatus Staskawiczbacteria bacterium]
MKLNSSDKCNFCMGATREYLTIKDLPILVGVPNNNPQKDCLDFSILMCEDCGLIQEKYSRSLDKKLEKIYLSKKASLSTPLGVGEWGKEMLETFLKDADIHYSPDEVLEVGCAAGGLLFKLFNKGCRNLSCFEPSSLVKKIPELGKNFSPHVYNTFFSSKEVKKQKVEG